VSFIDLTTFKSKTIDKASVKKKLGSSKAEVTLFNFGSASHSIKTSIGVDDPTKYYGYAQVKYTGFWDLFDAVNVLVSMALTIADPVTDIIAIFSLVTIKTSSDEETDEEDSTTELTDVETQKNFLGLVLAGLFMLSIILRFIFMLTSLQK